MPTPLVAFDCGSQSTSSVFSFAEASEAARLMAVVVFPTPPFWLATAIMRAIFNFLLENQRLERQHSPESFGMQRRITVQALKNSISLVPVKLAWVSPALSTIGLFHVEQL